MIEPINNIKNKSLGSSAGSLNKIIPAITVSAAPIPVHTAYAVPIGIPKLIALFNNIKLNIEDTKNQNEGQNFEKFSEYFKHTVNITSIKPPINKYIQANLSSP